MVLQYSSETVGISSTRYSLTVQLRDSTFCFYASFGTVLQNSSEIIDFMFIKTVQQYSSEAAWLVLLMVWLYF